MIWIDYRTKIHRKINELEPGNDVWYIDLPLPKNQPNVGKYTSPMDPMGDDFPLPGVCVYSQVPLIVNLPGVYGKWTDHSKEI